MNTKRQKLFKRLRNALDDISKSPKTAVEVTLLFEDLVASFEEIAADLKTMSDEETAATLRSIVSATTGTASISPEQMTAPI